jgi:hypothetical protein
MPVIHDIKEFNQGFYLKTVNKKILECKELHPNRKVVIFTYVGPGNELDVDDTDFKSEMRESRKITRKMVSSVKKIKIKRKIKQTIKSTINEKESFKTNNKFEILSEELLNEDTQSVYDDDDLHADVKLVNVIPKEVDIIFKTKAYTTDYIKHEVEVMGSYDHKDKEWKSDKFINLPSIKNLCEEQSANLLKEFDNVARDTAKNDEILLRTIYDYGEIPRNDNQRDYIMNPIKEIIKLVKEREELLKNLKDQIFRIQLLIKEKTEIVNMLRLSNNSMTQDRPTIGNLLFPERNEESKYGDIDSDVSDYSGDGYD